MCRQQEGITRRITNRGSVPMNELLMEVLRKIPRRLGFCPYVFSTEDGEKFARCGHFVLRMRSNVQVFPMSGSMTCGTPLRVTL